MKSKGVSYLLWFGGLVGLCGLHRFYMGKVGTGLIWLFTFGLFGFGQIIDLFLISSYIDAINTKEELAIMRAITMSHIQDSNDSKHNNI